MNPDEQREVAARWEGYDDGRIGTRTAILAALRAELPTFSCYEPSRLVGTPCSCVVGMARAIEIVEGMA